MLPPGFCLRHARPSHPLRSSCLQTVVDVEPLEAGRSIEVSGRLVVLRREPRAPLHAPRTAAPAAAPLALGEQALHYKLNDAGGVTFFPQLAR